MASRQTTEIPWSVPTRGIGWLERGRYLYAVLGLALLAILLAYQFRLPFAIDVGGPIDGPFLAGFHDPQVEKPARIHYRWTKGNGQIVLRDWGAGNPVELRVRLTRWNPTTQISDLTLYVNGIEFAEPAAAGQGWQEYVLPITGPQFLASDDLRVRFESDTFIPQKQIPGNPDPRVLGVQISSIRLLPLQNDNGEWRAVDGLVWSPFRLPPLDLTLYFIGSSLLVYLGLVIFKIPRRAALLFTALLALGAAAALVWVRPYLTLFADTFFLCLLASLAAGLLARALVPRFFAWGGLHATDLHINLLALLFALAFLLKLCMLLYPQTISFDLLYHIHRVQFVLNGKFFWSIESGKNEFGGQLVPYSPSFYIFLMPFANLTPLSLLVQLSGVLLDSVTIFFVYFLLAKYFDDARAGLFAAWIYILVPLAFIALSWGIYANIYGQFLTLLLVVALLEGLDRLNLPRIFIPIALLFALTLLSHLSVFASIVPLFAVWIGLLFVLGRMWRARPFWALMGSIAVASVIAFTVYYSEFVGLILSSTTQVVSANTDPSAAPVGDTGLSFWQLLQPARTEFIAVPLYVYAAALLGLAWLLYQAWRTPARGRFLLVTMLVAWFAAFALLIYLRSDFGFSSRYVNFAMPAIALCAGCAFSWVYARGLAGRALSLGLALVLAAQGLYHWYVLVMFKYH